MALKPVIDTLDGLPSAVREHYTKADDGKFRLTLDGEHPAEARVKEFRDSAIAAVKERDALKSKFDGIDPDTVKADRSKLAAFEQAKPSRTNALRRSKRSWQRRTSVPVARFSRTRSPLRSSKPVVAPTPPTTSCRGLPLRSPSKTVPSSARCSTRIARAKRSPSTRSCNSNCERPISRSSHPAAAVPTRSRMQAVRVAVRRNSETLMLAR